MAHGDIFSNERLARFGLRPDPSCPNCNEPLETIRHKIIDCRSATEAWQELERVKITLGLDTLSDLSMENLLGAKDRLNKIELTLQAELVHRLTSTDAKFNPKELVKRIVKFIGYSERLSPEQKERFNKISVG